jgi:hypothetical protein
MSTVNHGSSGRAERGRFAPGNQYAAGNPNHKRMYELRKALLDAATPEQVKVVADKMYDLATTGDVAAAKLWLEFVIGKPVQGIEVAGVGGSPLGMDWDRLQAVLLGALARFPEARIEVVAALRGLTDARGTEPA